MALKGYNTDYMDQRALNIKKEERLSNHADK